MTLATEGCIGRHMAQPIMILTVHAVYRSGSPLIKRPKTTQAMDTFPLMDGLKKVIFPADIL